MVTPAGMLDVRDVKLRGSNTLVTRAGAVGHMVLAVFIRLTFCMMAGTSCCR